MTNMKYNYLLQDGRSKAWLSIASDNKLHLSSQNPCTKNQSMGNHQRSIIEAYLSRKKTKNDFKQQIILKIKSQVNPKTGNH